MATTKVTTGGITDATIAAADIATGAVTEAKIQAFAVSETKIGDQAVTLAKLSHGTGSTDGKFLRSNNGADPTFETVSTDLVDDTSPQLGGDLDTNSFEISLDDNHAVKFGAGNDLKIQSDGSNSLLLSDLLYVNNSANTENIAKFVQNGAVELYYDNSKKFETTSTGISVTGNIVGSNHLELADNKEIRLGDSQDLQIYHSGFNYIESHNDMEVHVNAYTGGAAENMAKFKPNGAVELYHNNVKKIETTANGSTVTGTVSQTVLPSWSLRPNTASDVAGFPHSNMGHTIGWSADTTGASAKACHLSGGCTIAGMTGSPVGSGFQLASGGTTGKLIVPLAGKYSVWTKIRMETAASTGALKMFVNGTQVAAERTIHFNSSDNKPHSLGPMVLDLAANDYIEIVIEANIPSGAFSGYNKKFNWFTGHYIG